MKLEKNQQIKASFLKCPARVLNFEEKSDHFLLEVVLIGIEKYQSLRITKDQLSQIQLIDEKKIELTEKGEDFFALIEANRIRLAYQFDPFLALSTSQVDPLPHQIEAVYDNALQFPRIRFLIADDPGSGKTVMAGLILKELQYRRLVKRILIVAPGHLKYQWQREMKDKFNTCFRIVNRAILQSAWAENVWEENNLAISSIDFLKQDDIRNTLNSAYWDLIIVDEAHKMSAFEDGKKIKKTQRYRVGEVLSKVTDHLLFLTATPHRGSRENFRLFLDLLRPGFFAEVKSLEQAIKNKENPLFIRRLKEDLRDFKGKKIFLPRNVYTVRHKMTPEETELYNAVTRYVSDYYNRAKEKRYITFTMMLFQRRLTSSIHAIQRSLDRRLEKLEELENLPERLKDSRYPKFSGISEEILEDMEDKEREEYEKRLEQLTIAQKPEEIKEEIKEIKNLLEKVKQAKSQEIESKLEALKKDVLAQLGGRKLLIFTQFKDTLDYLYEKLTYWGYKVNTIHGGLSMDQRIDAEKEFKDETQILIGTEAAGEGINLQFCSLMVNYDIPWNPNRLEQRMGRIHRYGQKKEVIIWNMITAHTLEGRILTRLFEKMEQMRKDLGSDKVFDIIGNLVPGKNLEDLIKDAVFNQKNISDLEKEIDEVSRENVQQSLERAFSTSLASRFIDYSQLNEKKIQAEEGRLVPEYIEDYFLRIFKKIKGRIQKRSGYYHIEYVPFEIRKFNENYDFKVRYGKIYKRYPKVTFDKQVAKDHPEYAFVAPGHPLLEAINELVLQKFQGGIKTHAAFFDPKNQKRGVLWFLKGEITDGTGEPAGKRIFCIFQEDGGKLSKINPAILWDLEYIQEDEFSIPKDIFGFFNQEEEIKSFATNNLLFPYQQEIQKEREKEAKIKEKYGLRSLDYLMSESNQKLLEYQERKDHGEDMDLVIGNEEKRLDDLQRRKKELEEEIRLQSNLTVSSPEFIGSVIVVPLMMIEEKDEDKKAKQLPMRRDEDVEKVGMEETIKFENNHGWEPEDVSQDNYGFDVRSTEYDKDGLFKDIRYIEVKARAQSGAIQLSSNEWKKARHFKDKFWLYIVTNTRTKSPQLHRINNPADKFTLGRNIFAASFHIPLEKWEKVKE